MLLRNLNAQLKKFKSGMTKSKANAKLPLQRTYKFIQAYKSYWAGKKKRTQVRNVIHRFESWLTNQNICLAELTAHQLEQFLKFGRYRPLQKNTRGNYMAFIRSYICWLNDSQKIQFTDFENLIRDAEFKRNRELSPLALEYLDLQRPLLRYTNFISLRSTLIRMNIFLQKEEVDILGLNQKRLVGFANYLEVLGLGKSTIEVALIYLRKYLEWLGDIKKITIEFENHLPKARYSYIKFLSEDNKLFLKHIGTTLCPSTCSDYRGSFVWINKFLAEKNISITDLNRSEVEIFLQWLQSKQFSILHRRKIIINFRVYLYWLNDRGSISCDPSSIIKSNDFPKKPLYLPRPLPREIDATIIEKFEKSADIHHKGLLLMRKTGLRIGELHSLKFECIRKDSAEHFYLKVELGKLNSERLVPIDEKTVALISEIQNKSLANLKNKNKKTSVPENLLIDSFGKHANYTRLFVAFKEITRDIASAEKIVPHRLRHTYATELLSAGMSLASIMHILGHRTIGMTLRYAAVVPETMRNEYLLAIERINQVYEIPIIQKPEPINEDLNMKDFILVLRKIQDDPKYNENKSKLRLILKRMHRLQSEIDSIFIKK